MKTDIVIVGSGVAGLYCALHLPRDKQILILTKAGVEQSDSYLAQGGICTLKEEADYESFFEDTMKAGHYENNRASVEVMIRSSGKVIKDLVSYGVLFEKDGNYFKYTKEGAHSVPRILFHKDITGKEITSHLLEQVRKRSNVKIMEYTAMIDLLCEDNSCKGVVARKEDGTVFPIYAYFTVVASGGIGGLYSQSTNYKHLTGDALAIAINKGIDLEHLDYIQIHPTTLYTTKEERSFLISESVRGEGAVLYNAAGERFVDELLPRDVVTNAIDEQMEKEGSEHVWLSMHNIPEETIREHFPNIYERCLAEGYDVTKEPIPVVPAQHYFMGGIKVDLDSRTSMERLFAIGEISCNGVHGANRLASNSLLESLVFAKRSAQYIEKAFIQSKEEAWNWESELKDYPRKEELEQLYKDMILKAIEKEKKSHE